jgi:hypothetical protein
VQCLLCRAGRDCLDGICCAIAYDKLRIMGNIEAQAFGTIEFNCLIFKVVRVRSHGFVSRFSDLTLVACSRT